MLVSCQNMRPPFKKEEKKTYVIEANERLSIVSMLSLSCHSARNPFGWDFGSNVTNKFFILFKNRKTANLIVDRVVPYPTAGQWTCPARSSVSTGCWTDWTAIVLPGPHRCPPIQPWVACRHLGLPYPVSIFLLFKQSL